MHFYSVVNIIAMCKAPLHVNCYLVLDLSYIFIYFVCMCVHVCLNTHTHAKVHMWRSNDNFWESVLFFHHVSPGEMNSHCQALQEDLYHCAILLNYLLWNNNV